MVPAMNPVSKSAFFEAVGPLDVHPRPDVSTFKGRYHTSIWEIQTTRRVVGKDISDSHGVEETQFFLK